MSQVTLNEARGRHVSIWQRIFLWFCKFVPSPWLSDALKEKHNIYVIVLMNTEDGETVMGGKYDGMFELSGTLTYCVSPALLEGIFDELDKRMEVDRMIAEANKTTNPGESYK